MEKSKEYNHQHYTFNFNSNLNLNINVQDTRVNNEKSAVNNEKPTPSAPDTQKIKSTFSVSQLAFFFRLLHDIGFFAAISQNSITKFIAANFFTDNVLEISENSLRSRYYSTDPAAKEFMKKMLQKMISKIDQY